MFIQILKHWTSIDVNFASDKNVIVLSGEVTNQNIVRLGLKDEFQVKAERHKQQNNRQVVSSENIGVDSLDKLDKKGKKENAFHETNYISCKKPIV